jgi:hypothetical protein
MASTDSLDIPTNRVCECPSERGIGRIIAEILVVVAYRGSNSFENWEKDLEFWLTDYAGTNVMRYER